MQKRRSVILVLLLIVSFNLPLRGQSVEYTIKTALIERFTRFIEWSDNLAIDDTTKIFILGVIGKNPFGTALNEFFANQKIKNRRVEIRYLSSIEEIEGCHLLFIGKAGKNRIKQIISFTKDKPILTISDSKGNAQRGVHINFYQSKEKIRFEINESAVRDSGLSMSYLLLQLARIVNPTGD